MIKKGLIHEENIKILNVSAPNNIFKICEAKMNATKRTTRQIHNYTWRLQHSSLSNQTSNRKKIKKDKEVLNHTINQLDLINIHKALHLTRA